MRRLGWTHDFSGFLAQPGLVDDLVPGLRGDIEAMAARPGDILDQAGLLWNVIHTVIDRYRRDHPDWMFVRHEDLSAAPLDGFRDLADGVGLDFTPGCGRTSPRRRGRATRPRPARESYTSLGATARPVRAHGTHVSRPTRWTGYGRARRRSPRRSTLTPSGVQPADGAALLASQNEGPGSRRPQSEHDERLGQKHCGSEGGDQPAEGESQRA